MENQEEVTERILCAAVFVETGKADPPRRSYAYPKTGLMFCGWRHGDCFCTMESWWEGLLPEEQEAVCELNPEGTPYSQQGFLTSTGRYVNREDAAKIATAAGQIPGPKRTLFSEDLY